ncbi:MAG TPA: hypothetical protein VK717_00105 [Opitutaceae bacterium]|nr:hypothetical protein [Opitutaceae bacterium]
MFAGTAVLPAAPAPDRIAVLEGYVQAQLIKLDRSLAAPRPQPTVRDLSHAALASLILGQPPARAENYLRCVFALQNMDPSSPDFGNVPWQQNHPAIRDANAIEFTMEPVGAIFLLFGEKLPPDFRAEARPHLTAALAAIHRHQVKVTYTNIFLMKLANLLALGAALDDSAARTEGMAMLDEFIRHTRANGISEFASPTYSAVQMSGLELLVNTERDPAVRAKVRALLAYFWTDLAADYYAPTGVLAGAHSRVYDFLTTDDNVNQLYYRAGLREAAPPPLLMNDQVLIWANARLAGYAPPALALDLARQPARLVRARYGDAPGQDRTLCITPHFALGSASTFAGLQSRALSVILGARPGLPFITFASDIHESPYGKIRVVGSDGHAKPRVLMSTLASVQENSTVLALLDLAPALRAEKGEVASVATSLVVPLQAERLALDNTPLDLAAKTPRPVALGSVLVVREGGAAVAVRVFAADALDGSPAAIEFKTDGAEWGAGRLAIYHYRGPPKKLSPKNPVRVGVLVLAGDCPDAPAEAALVARVKSADISSQVEDSVWTATVKLAGEAPHTLEAALDFSTHTSTGRKIDGRPFVPPRFTVNGRDLAAELLDAAPLATP